ncbi:hypothetical protein BC830DRAFT_1173205 [Chytriomyces sp. MP71]|nr:hypothetical protein BC830DRAFT_1173205 [Chytriomyces sp. MP71]
MTSASCDQHATSLRVSNLSPYAARPHFPGRTKAGLFFLKTTKDGLRHKRVTHLILRVSLLLALLQLLMLPKWLAPKPQRPMQQPTTWSPSRWPADSLSDEPFLPPRDRNATWPGPVVAYGLLCHNNETAAGVVALITSLWLPTDLFVIHVDAKAGLGLVAMLHHHFANTRNVVVLAQSFQSGWGEVELLGAELELIKSALDLHKMLPWELFLLLDGTTIPLQSLGTLKYKLEPLAKQQLNSVYDSRTGPHALTCNYFTSLLNICSCNFHRGYCADLSCTTFNRTPKSRPVFKGTQWVILTRPFAQHAALEAQDWLEFFGGSFAADETFFPSVLESVSDKFKGSDLALNNVFKVWSTWGCASYKPARKNGDGPCYLGRKEWPLIQQAQKDGYLFARKVRVDQTDLQRMITNSLIGGQYS